MANIISCKDPADLALRAADFILATGRSALQQRGQFTLVLTGGSTPKETYKLLAQPERASQLDWSKTYLFIGDERFVPADDERSNFRLAQQSLLTSPLIRSNHVLAVPTDTASAEQSAQRYAKMLHDFFPGEALPHFDLILLGLGEDGHVASLFPGAPALAVTDVWVTWSPPGTLPPPVDRITMTYPVLNAARQIAFLVAGLRKAPVVKAILQGKHNREIYPASGIQPAAGEVTWIADQASLLESRL